jgi:hypothetical protein
VFGFGRECVWGIIWKRGGVGGGGVVVECKFNHDFLSGRLIISIMAFASVYKYNNT